MPHAKNPTRFKTLDPVAADPRVSSLEVDSDGVLVVTLKPGFVAWDGDSSVRGMRSMYPTIHAWTVRELLARFRHIEARETNQVKAARITTRAGTVTVISV